MPWFTRDYVRLALGSDVGSAEPLAVTEQDKEFPALSREVDFVARVGWQEEAEPAAILEHSQRLILEEITPGEAQADAYVGLRETHWGVFTTIRDRGRDECRAAVGPDDNLGQAPCT